VDTRCCKQPDFVAHGPGRTPCNTHPAGGVVVGANGVVVGADGVAVDVRVGDLDQLI
jgi:hypothetical protein